MRISAGQFKGRKIGSKKLFAKKVGKDDLRPTSSKVREALFDILRGEIDGSSFLDLYAGTGTVGMEAASRGAVHIVFVEPVRSRAKVLGDMINKLELGEKAVLHCEHAEFFLKRASQYGETFYIIFADPPYGSDELQKILPLIAEYGILNKQGALLCEHAAKVSLPETVDSLRLRKQYRYGDTRLSLYRRQT